MNKIYETSSYQKELKMKVTASFTVDGEFFIMVDSSIFFPEEGGQYADTGVLTLTDIPDEYQGDLKVGDGVKLLDGQIAGGAMLEKLNEHSEGSLSIQKGDIYYKVDALIPKGAIAEGRLDFEKRFDRMQNHSGEHILTGVIHNKYGFNNVGFHLSDEGFVTLDLDGVLSYDQVIEMENVANEVIYENLPIRDSYPSKDELKDISYRSKIEIDGQVRLITVGSDEKKVDVCACCAPHVGMTGAVGIIKVISVINYKKGIQIAILCGRRALEYINNEHSMMTSLSRSLSTSYENVSKIVKSHMDEISALKERVSAIIEKSISERIEQMDENACGCIFTDEDLNAANMKNIYNVMNSKITGYVGIFVGNDESGYRFNAGGRSLDARELSAILREKLGAKGGGSAEMIQGRVNSSQKDITEVFELLKN